MNNRPSLKLKGEQEEAGEGEGEEPLFYSSFYSRIYICIFLFSFATQLTTPFRGTTKASRESPPPPPCYSESFGVGEESFLHVGKHLEVGGWGERTKEELLPRGKFSIFHPATLRFCFFSQNRRKKGKRKKGP